MTLPSPRRHRLLPLAGLLAFLAVSPAVAATTFNGVGTSAAGNPVAFRATMAISGTVLSVRLDNISPVATKASADVLSSFYFDVVKSGSIRPTVTYLTGTGQVYQVISGSADRAVIYSPPSSIVSGTGASNLKATSANDKTWEFRAMDPTLPPLEGFGIGTVGNSGLAPNGFTAAIVGPAGPGQVAFSIYTGADINPVGSLDRQYLVRDTATFTFGLYKQGFTFTEADIGPDALFGLGTGPDSVIELPEPGGLSIAASGLVLACGWRVCRSRGAARRGRA